MRKNKTMRFASMLLVLTLLSTSVISGTFAKYVTSDSATDEARVAKWGVVVTATDDTMFKKVYDNETTPTVKTVAEYGDDNLVAPGTSGALTSNLTITGKPEVKVKVEFEPVLTLTGWDDYCPLKITVNGTEYTGTAAELKTKVEDAIKTKNAEYAPGTDLSAAEAPTVEWSWPYHTSDENDVKDTTLGNAGTAKIKLELTTTVTQVD